MYNYLNKSWCSKLLLILGIITNTIPRYLDFTNPLFKKFYYTGQALSFLLIMLAGYFKPHNNKPLAILFELSIWLAVNNLMDELFFDPLSLGFNEVIFALIIILHAAYQYRQYKGKKVDNA